MSPRESIPRPGAFVDPAAHRKFLEEEELLQVMNEELNKARALIAQGHAELEDIDGLMATTARVIETLEKSGDVSADVEEYLTELRRSLALYAERRGQLTSQQSARMSIVEGILEDLEAIKRSLV